MHFRSRIELYDLIPIRRVCVLFLLACMVRFLDRSGGAQQPAKTQRDAVVTVHFTDIRKAAGITFVQDSTQTDEKYYLETMGTGVAWLDYDQDGLMDLYFVQIRGHRCLQTRLTPCAPRSIAITATAPLPTLPTKPALAEKDTTARA